MLPPLRHLVRSMLAASTAQPQPRQEATVQPRHRQDMVQLLPPLVLHLHLLEQCPPHQATAQLQQAVRQRLPLGRRMLDHMARTDLLGPRDVKRGTLTFLFNQAPIFPPLYLCKHTPNYPTTPPPSIPTQPTNFHLGLSSSFKHLAKPRAASPCPARCVPPPLSRSAARCHVPRAEQCLVSVAAR